MIWPTEMGEKCEKKIHIYFWAFVWYICVLQGFSKAAYAAKKNLTR